MQLAVYCCVTLFAAFGLCAPPHAMHSHAMLSQLRGRGAQKLEDMYLARRAEANELATLQARCTRRAEALSPALLWLSTL